MNRFLLSSLSCLLGSLPPLTAQTDEHVEFDRPEAWAMQYFTAAGLMQGSAPPATLARGGIALGFEVANIPHLSRRTRTVGFFGTKEENLNKAPVLARPLLHYGLTDRFSVTASYVPPFEVFDRLKTHLVGFFVNYTAYQTESLRLTLRVGGQWSEAEGDFTCAEEISGVDDFAVNPFGCVEPSHDVFRGKSLTAELGLDYRLQVKALPLSVFGNLAYTRADLEFEVDALWAGGFADQRRLFTSGDLWSFGAGLKAEIRDGFYLSLSVVHAPLDIIRPPDFKKQTDSLTHFRLTLTLYL